MQPACSMTGNHSDFATSPMTQTCCRTRQLPKPPCRLPQCERECRAGQRTACGGTGSLAGRWNPKQQAAACNDWSDRHAQGVDEHKAEDKAVSSKAQHEAGLRRGLGQTA